MNPAIEGTSLCLRKTVGVAWWPGCGLGRAIHEALQLHFRASLEAHLLGVPAAILLVQQAIKNIYLTQKTSTICNSKKY